MATLEKTSTAIICVETRKRVVRSSYMTYINGGKNQSNVSRNIKNKMHKGLYSNKAQKCYKLNMYRLFLYRIDFYRI